MVHATLCAKPRADHTARLSDDLACPYHWRAWPLRVMRDGRRASALLSRRTRVRIAVAATLMHTPPASPRLQHSLCAPGERACAPSESSEVRVRKESSKTSKTSKTSVERVHCWAGHHASARRAGAGDEYLEEGRVGLAIGQAEL